MKFRKILRTQVEQTLPEWRDKFLSYKQLKKQLKLICLNNNATPSSLLETHVTIEVNAFLQLLMLEIDKFNTFFVEREEEYIIKWKELSDRVARAEDSDIVELMSLKREIVDFHGEMVLLHNYSALNCTGLVKIIKKYDKRTGALLRLPFIQEVLNQPFFKFDVLNKLIKECEVMLSVLLSSNRPSGEPFSANKGLEEDGCAAMTGDENEDTLMEVPEEIAEIEEMENKFISLTLSALRTLEEIRGGSSSFGSSLLPPLHN